MYLKNCMLQAHRGVSTDYPENTMAAFRGAVTQGYDIIELDPAVTSDGEFVILHDKTVNRTGRKGGDVLPVPMYISEMKLSEALELDFGAWFSDDFVGERIPTLHQVLELSAQTGIKLKFDNKMQLWAEDSLYKFFDIIDRHPAKENIGFTCSDIEYAEKVTRRFPNLTLHYDGAPDPALLKRLQGIRHGAETFIWLRFPNTHTSWCKTPPISEELCRKVKPYGRLGVWLISDPKEAEAAVKRFGAEVIETTGAIKPN